MKQLLIRVSGILLSFYLLNGCTGLNTFPGVARGGDTLMLPVGTPEGMTKNNISVTWISDVDSSTVDLTPNVTALLKLYPSKLSTTALDELDLVYKAGHEAWLSTLAVDLPLSTPDGGPLVVGTGTINVSCVPRTDCVSPPGYPHNNDVDMAVEILPGLGSPNPYGYDGGILGAQVASPASLEDRDHVELKTTHGAGLNTGPTSGPIMGAAEFVIIVPMRIGVGSPPKWVDVPVSNQDVVLVAEDTSVYSGSQRSFLWRKTGDTFTVSFVSHTGMLYPELRFSVASKPPSDSNSSNVFSALPTIVSATYYDLNGAVITTDAPTSNVNLLGDLAAPF